MAKAKSDRNQRGDVVWTKAWDALLGTMTDDRLGGIMGCSREAVRRRRLRNDVPAFRAEFVWTEKADELVRSLPIAQAAKRLKVTNTAVRIRRMRTGAAKSRI